MLITANWKILKEMGIPDHLTYLLRNQHASQEATVKIRYGIKDNLTCVLRNLYVGQEITELDMEQQTGSKL